MPIVVAPFVVLFTVLAIRAAGVDWQPAQDFALFELRIGDVGTAHSPLVGAYSRFGWSHPGPLLFYALALPFRLLGGRSQGMLVGATLINGAALVGALLLARRRGGTALLIGVAIGGALLLRSMGADLLMSPWNPWIIIVPTFAFLLLAWSLACRDWTMLPITALVASFLVQTHVALAGLVGAVLAVAALFAVATRTTRTTNATNATSARLRRSLLLAGAVLAVVWVPVAIDQLAGTHNSSRLARYFASSQGDRPSAEQALGVIAIEMEPDGPWLTGPEEIVPFTGDMPVEPASRLALPVLALVGAAAITFGRRDREGLALVLIASAALVAAVLSVARISGHVWPYLVRFTWSVALLVWLAVARALVPAVVALIESWRSSAATPDTEDEPGTEVVARATTSVPGSWAVVAAVVATLVVATIVVPMDVTAAQPPDAGESADLARMIDAIESAVVGKVDGVVLVRPADTDILFPAPDSRGAASGVVAALRKQGVDARVVDEDWKFDAGNAGAQLFGDWRLDDGGPIAGTITLVGVRKIDTFVPTPGAVELYRVDNRAEVEEIRRIEADLARGFTEAGHPESVPLIEGEGVRWVGFNVPELGRFGVEIDRLVTLRAHRREVVYWHPGR